MKYKKSLLYYSLLSALVMMPRDSLSAIRIGNKSRNYADAYNEVNELRAAVAAPSVASAHSDDLGLAGKTEDSSSLAELPIRVANQTLASQIARGDSMSVTVGQLQNCGLIYPNGDFAWDMPTAGARAGTGSQCVSVIEMRGYQMGANGSDLVLARVNVGAGDSVKCNISAWPESSYLPAAGTIEFPNDAEPTVEDVIQAMNQEQKQNAGIKIAAGTLLAAVAGNALGAKEVGKDALLGTNKDKLQSTAIGAATGAAIMAGNVYGGKVAGDMILSAGINAAAGGLIGNMAASGDAVLKIESCSYLADNADIKAATKTAPANTDNEAATEEKNSNSKEGKSNKAKGTKSNEQKCLWGLLIKQGTKESDVEFFYDIAKEVAYSCKKTTAGNGAESFSNCAQYGKELADIKLEGYGSDVTDTKGEKYDLVKAESEGYKKTENSYSLDEKEGTMTLVSKTTPDKTAENRFAKIIDYKIVEATENAVWVGVTDRPFGWKKKEWDKFKEEHPNITIMKRDANGNPVALAQGETIDIKNFTPIYKDAEDGALVDLGNKARLKGTLIGAGAGGALGAFTAYQGAQNDIQERWVTEVRRYKDSLQKVYCATGGRFLSHYNDMVTIPAAAE